MPENQNENQEISENDKPTFPAIVVSVVDSYTVAINRGSFDGIRIGQRFLIYGLSTSELFDPQTGESLGYLEIVRGTGVATHVQDKLTTIKSDMKRKSQTKTVRKSQSWLNPSEEIIESPYELSVPFDEGVYRGDRAKPI